MNNKTNENQQPCLFQTAAAFTHTLVRENSSNLWQTCSIQSRLARRKKKKNDSPYSLLSAQIWKNLGCLLLWNPALCGFQTDEHGCLKISEICGLAGGIESERRSYPVDFGRSGRSSTDFSWVGARPTGHKTPLGISSIFHLQYWQGSYRQNVIDGGTQASPQNWSFVVEFTPA